jgi:hypothetical protein
MTAYTFDESIVSDLHKDAYGFRPTSGWWDCWNFQDDEGKQAAWNTLLDDLEQSRAEQRAEQDSAVKQFEGRIELLMNMGASNRETAIRWIIESMNLSETEKLYGGEYVCFELGLPYNMKEIFTHLMC